MNEYTPSPSLSDEELLHRSAAGDDAAFEALVNRYSSRILNLACRYTRDPAEAEDMSAEIFFRVWRYAKDFKGSARFSTWLYRIAVNVCLNFRKRTSRFPFFRSLEEPVATDEGELPREIPDTPAGEPEHATQAQERAAAVQQALKRLAPQQRMAFILSHFEGYSYKETAEIMKTSVSAVESLLFRAKESLRRALAPLREESLPEEPHRKFSPDLVSNK